MSHLVYALATENGAYTGSPAPRVGGVMEVTSGDPGYDMTTLVIDGLERIQATPESATFQLPSEVGESFHAAWLAGQDVNPPLFLGVAPVGSDSVAFRLEPNQEDHPRFVIRFTVEGNTVLFQWKQIGAPEVQNVQVTVTDSQGQTAALFVLTPAAPRKEQALDFGRYVVDTRAYIELPSLPGNHISSEQVAGSEQADLEVIPPP